MWYPEYSLRDKLKYEVQDSDVTHEDLVDGRVVRRRGVV